MSRVLIIDDEEIIVEAIQTILTEMGHIVAGFSNSEDGITEAIKNPYDLIITDLRMPRKNGAQVTKEIIANKPDAKILIITAYPTDNLAKQALDAGARSLIMKPFEISKILHFLQAVT